MAQIIPAGNWSTWTNAAGSCQTEPESTFRYGAMPNYPLIV